MAPVNSPAELRVRAVGLVMDKINETPGLPETSACRNVGEQLVIWLFAVEGVVGGWGAGLE
ncbi:hypothetical protein [Falsarthrobacter nasiphocae]|uniref:Uncharacterized protein n=1 Tax=Falsarthrobacter nasiphocae TaxID=189863 RepID=A0AAE4C5Z7_9MICC|nr:hypothetical protein [Falsarthrobacter nasiphocae]MDR6891592.1 hypothetical protein [Falsarthrobacter nasiphocae]